MTSFVAEFDPRLRIAIALGFAVIVVACDTWPPLVGALGLSLIAAIAARLPAWATLRRLLAMDGFMIVALAFLPFTLPGDMVFSIADLPASRQGLMRAGEILLTANAVLLMLLALVGTMESVTLGHAMVHLGLPAKLVHLFLFTIRYIDLLRREMERLRLAMRARAFRPRANFHTWHSYGQMFGMLLVRSLERSERILDAMRCRGFDGRFHVLDHDAMQMRDWLAASTALAVGAGFLIWDKLP